MTFLKKATHVFAFLLMAAPPAFAASTPVGRVAAFRGEITATSRDTVRSLTTHSPIFEEDVITTQERSRLQLQFKDNTLITLGPASELVIKEYRWDDQKKEGAFTHEVREGIFRVLGGAITKASPDQFKTETPVATIGIRGSIYAGSFRLGVLTVLFQGGKGIDVYNAVGTVPVTTPGFGTKVSGKDEPPETPKPFTSKEVEKIDLQAPPPKKEEEKKKEEQDPQPEKKTEEAKSEEEKPENSDSEKEEEIFSENFEEKETDENGVEKKPGESTSTEKPEESVPAETPDEVPDDPPVATFHLKGHHRAANTDPSKQSTDLWSGPMELTLQSGAYNATFASGGSLPVEFGFAVPGYNEGAPYVGPTETSQTRKVFLGGTTHTFAMATLTDPTGEFLLFKGENSYKPDDTTLTFQDIGYAGIESSQLPSTGISTYGGFSMAANQPTEEGVQPHTLLQGYGMAVNWKNGKFMGRMGASGSQNAVILLGKITGGTPSVFAILTPSQSFDEDPEAIDLQSENISFVGSFYGSFHQGFGFHGSSSRVSLTDPSKKVSTFSFTGGGMREVAQAISPSGSQNLTGFLSGIALNTEDQTDRFLYLSTAPNELSLGVNKETGEVSGSFEAKNSGGDTLGVTVGEAGQSAFIDQGLFGALLSKGNSGEITDIHELGSYMVTAPKEEQFSEHLSWGYWETAYEKSGSQYHVKGAGSHWIAGEQTEPSQLSALVNDATTSYATYEGKAQGILISGGTVQQLSNGTSHFTFNFGGGLNHFDAIIAFNGTTVLEIKEDGIISQGGFSFDGISDPNNANSKMNGAFFGPNHEAVGGNFQTIHSGGDTYQGIFGASRQ